MTTLFNSTTIFTRRNEPSSDAGSACRFRCMILCMLKKEEVKEKVRGRLRLQRRDEADAVEVLCCGGRVSFAASAISLV